MKIELDKIEALRILEILHDLHKMTMDDFADPKIVGTLQAKAFTSALDVRESLNKAYVKLHAFRTKNFRSYRVKYYFNHQFHERFMSVNWISYERDIESIIHAEFGHAAHVIDVMPYLD